MRHGEKKVSHPQKRNRSAGLSDPFSFKIFRCFRAVHDLVFFLLPDVVGTLSPAVCASLVNAILAFESVKPSTLAHKQTLNTLMTLLSH